MGRKEKLDKLKVLLFWLGAFMASIGFWMLFVMITGYSYPIPWWTNILQKANWIMWALLYGAITGYLLTYLIKRKAGFK